MMWLRTDEYQEIVATIRACCDFRMRADRDITYWKWFFIALHNLVQGCMVVALTRSDEFGAIDPKHEEAWQAAYDSDGPFPTEPEKLLPFMDLYERIKKQGLIQYSSADRFTPRGTQTRSMRKLNSIRNEFIHFTPKGWTLQLSGAPLMAIDCIDVAVFLVESSGRFAMFLSYKEGELLGLLKELRMKLAAERKRRPNKRVPYR